MKEWNDELRAGTVLNGKYRIETCEGRLRHSKHEFSSYIYRAGMPDGKFCTVYEYFPDSWDCVAERDDRQHVCWDLEKVRKRMLQYRVSSEISSPEAFLEDIFRRFCADAELCVHACENGLSPAFCQITCDTFRANGTCYVVLPEDRPEYTLCDVALKHRNPLDEGEVKAVIRNCLDDLAVLHGQGISHGAISPWSFVFSEGRFILTGFGKPKARKFSSLADWEGPVSEGPIWFETDSPEWYNSYPSENDVDSVAILRVLRFCAREGSWRDSTWDTELMRSGSRHEPETFEDDPCMDGELPF